MTTTDNTDHNPDGPTDRSEAPEGYRNTDATKTPEARARARAAEAL